MALAASYYYEYAAASLPSACVEKVDASPQLMLEIGTQLYMLIHHLHEYEDVGAEG